MASRPALRIAAIAGSGPARPEWPVWWRALGGRVRAPGRTAAPPNPPPPRPTPLDRRCVSPLRPRGHAPPVADAVFAPSSVRGPPGARAPPPGTTPAYAHPAGRGSPPETPAPPAPPPPCRRG